VIRRRCWHEGDRSCPREAGDPRPARRGGRVGKVIDLDIDAIDAAEAKARVEQMCGQLLANPNIESYEVTIAQ
jgi:hypothetical protein